MRERVIIHRILCNEYFEDDVREEYDENPLKDSANYQVTIKFFSDTNNVREQIENIPGVRMVADQRERVYPKRTTF